MKGRKRVFFSDPRAALGALFQVNLEHFYGPVIYDWPTGTVLMVAVGAGPATELGPRLITGTRVWSFKSSASPQKMRPALEPSLKAPAGEGNQNEMSFSTLNG